MSNVNAQHIFQLPYHIGKAGASLAAFSIVSTPQQCIVDRRTAEEIEMAKENRPTQTLRPNAEVFEERAQLITQVPTKVVWCHNI